jgi:microcin C transport system substrate-binding protein
MRSFLPRSLVLVTALVFAACGGGTSNTQQPQASNPTAPAAGAANISTDKNGYPVFVDKDAGADPSVPPEQGGKGFTGEGWDTNTSFDLIGDPHAVKGGVFREGQPDYPATLRYIGPNLSVWNATLHGLVYESLLGLHPTTLEYIPVVATHWQILPDKLTYRFRLDPNARFSDGTPVTADDVIATWKLYTDKTVQDPLRNAMYLKYEQPVAESKYIVRVKSKEPGWTGFYYFSGLPVYPAHALKGVTGASYLKDFNDKMLPGTGPYAVTPADLDKGNAIHIRRRPNYWAEKYRRNVGLNNFDEIRDVTVRDRNLEFEMLKRGDLDYFHPNRAQQWVQELNFDKIQNGVLQKRKVWNHAPQSIQGIAMNTRRPPYDDVRVREALRHLYNRELMIEKLAFNEYVPLDSIYPGSIYENPNNEKIKFDPRKAVQLLAEAGWKDRNAQGLLVKNGTPLSIEVIYYDRANERYLTIFQEDLRKVGITLNLRYVTPETGYKMVDEQQFGMFSIGWGGGGPFPIPEQFWQSDQADVKTSGNITGFKNPRVDEIIKAYNVEFDVKKRAALLRELDGIVSSQHHYLLEWYAPYDRMVYWNRFGQPKGVITRIGDYRDPVGLWWIDPQKNAALEAALRDPSKKLSVGQTDDRYWLEFDKVEEQQTPSSEGGQNKTR